MLIQIFVIAVTFMLNLSQALAKSYVGTGFWENSGGLSGQYETQIKISEDVFQSSYIDQYGERKRIFRTLGPRKNFSFIMNEKFFGIGSCYYELCHFSWIENGDEISESWIFQDDKVVRYGTRHDEQSFVNWKDESQSQ